MIEPELVRGIVDLGVAGVLVIGFGLLMFRKLRTEGEVRDLVAVLLERLADERKRGDEYRVERDAWRALAETSGDKVELLADAIDKLAAKVERSG